MRVSFLRPLCYINFMPRHQFVVVVADNVVLLFPLLFSILMFLLLLLLLWWCFMLRYPIGTGPALRGVGCVGVRHPPGPVSDGKLTTLVGKMVKLP